MIKSFLSYTSSGDNSCHKTTTAACFLALFAFSFAGCGKKGPPLPLVTVTPEAVKGFEVEGREEGLLITWRIPQKNSDGSPVTDLAGFKLHKKTEGCGSCPSDFPLYIDVDIDLPGIAAVEGENLYLLDREVRVGESYRYKVVPYSRSGYFGEFSEVISAKWLQVPPAPEGVEAEAGDRSVRLSWAPYEPEGFAGYRVYRREASGNYGRQALANSPVKEAGYTDIGIENNRQYYYVVQALLKEENTFIEGPPSREVLAVPVDMMPPAAPQGLRVVPSYEEVHLSWEGVGGEDVAGYFIYRRKDGELAMEKLNIVPEKVNYYSDADISAGEKYFYTVTAVDSSPQKNESGSSEEIVVTVPGKP